MFTRWLLLFIVAAVVKESYQDSSAEENKTQKNNVKGYWLTDLFKGKSVDAGSDLAVSLRKVTNERSFLASHAIHVDLFGIGISFSKSKTANGVNVGFYIGDSSTEARAKKNKLATVFLPLIIGYKAAAILFGTLVVVSGVLLKSLLAAKTALLVTGSVGLKKLFSSGGEHHQIHLYPRYDDIHTSSSEYHHSSVPYQVPYHREDVPVYEMQETKVSPIYVAAPAAAALVAAVPASNVSTQAQDIKRKYHVKKKQILKPIYSLKMTN